MKKMRKWKKRVLAWMLLFLLLVGNTFCQCGGEVKASGYSFGDEATKYASTFEDKYPEYTKTDSVQEGDFTIDTYQNKLGGRKRCVSKYSGKESVITLPLVDCIMEEVICQNSAVTEIIIPSSITDIFQSNISECKNLKKVTFLGGNTGADLYIGPGVMAKCSNLEEVSFSKRKNCVLANSVLYLASSLKEVHFPEFVSLELGSGVLMDCTKLEDITFEGYVSLRMIGLAFPRDTSLKKINLPACNNPTSSDNVQKGILIGICCFQECSSLEEIILPQDITYIGSNAFAGVKGARIYAQPGTVGYEYFAGNSDNVLITELSTPKPTQAVSLAPVPTPVRTPIPTPGYTPMPVTPEPTVEVKETPVPTQKAEETVVPSCTAPVMFPTEYSEETLEPSAEPQKDADIVEQVEPGTKIRFVYNTQGGILSSSYNTDTVRYMDVYSDLETATRKGYIFDGWYTLPEGGEKIENGTLCDKEINALYAHWTPCSYTLFLNPNFGEVDRVEKSVTYGQPYGSLPIPKKEGSVFKGWYTRTNMGQLVTSEDICYAEENITLYAVWENEYDVEFNAKGGKASFIRKLVKKGSAYGALPTAEKEGFVFDGWYTESIGGTRVTSDMLFAMDAKQVLYAQWVKAEGDNIQMPVQTQTPEPVPPVPTPTVSPIKEKEPVQPTKTPTVKQEQLGKVKLASLKKDGKKIKVTWKKIKNAKGYEIQIATNKNFSKGLIKKRTTKLTYVSSKLKTGKKYYIRVRAYKSEKNKKTIYGKYSDVKNIRFY